MWSHCPTLMFLLFIIQVTCWWLFYISVPPVVGAPSHITLIGTGSGASVHQGKPSKMVSLQNTQVHLIRYYSSLASEILCFTFVSPLTEFFLVDVFQFLSTRHAESPPRIHVSWIHVRTEASARGSHTGACLSALVLRASVGDCVSRVGRLIIILWMTSIIPLFIIHSIFVAY